MTTQGSQDPCSICRQNEGEGLYKLHCKHTFHRECMNMWLRASNSKVCPLCRQDLDAVSSALKKGDPEGLEKLLREKEDCRVRNKHVQEAIKMRRLDLLKILYEGDEEVDATFCLFEAIKTGTVEMVSYFLDQEAECNDGQCTALQMATDGNKLEMAKLLIDRGCDIDERTENINSSCLAMAVSYGYVEMVKLLLEAGATVGDDKDLLMPAVKSQQKELVKIILKLEIDIHFQEDAAFMMAVRLNDMEMVEMLVEAGADVTAQNNKCIMFALMHSNLKMIRFLLSSGAQVDVKSDPKMLFQVGFRKDITIVKLFKKLGVPLEFGGQSALIGAIVSEHLPMIRYLIEGGGCDIEFNSGEPLRTAVRCRSIRVANYLIEKGADVNGVFEGRALLTSAVLSISIWGHRIIKLLVESGADVKADDSYAAVCAATRNFHELVKYLVGRGAKRPILSEINLTTAYEHGHHELIEYRLKQGTFRVEEMRPVLKLAIAKDDLKFMEICVYLPELGKIILEEASQVGAVDFIKRLRYRYDLAWLGW